MRQILKYIFALAALLSCSTSFAQPAKWQDMYQVKKKDTIYGIAAKYKVSITELMDANPDMKMEGYKLKKGDYIYIPYAKTQSVVKPSTMPMRIDDVKGRAIRIGVILPLHDNDGDGTRMTEYYRGLLMACDSLKREGVSTEIQAWNVPDEADIATILLSDNAKNRDVIFGPLYTPQVEKLADFCMNRAIKLVIPFSIDGNEVAVNPEIFQVYQSQGMLNEASTDAFVALFGKYHPVFIDCNDSTSDKGAFTFGLRGKLDNLGIKYNITNLKSSEAYFAKAFSKTQPNIVVLNTGKSPQLNVAIAKLNGYKVANTTAQISLFGYTEWLMYTKYDLDNFFKFDTYIPSTFYYNPLSAATKNLEANYRKWFHADMLNALPRFAITGYDQARFILGGIHKYGRAFVGSREETVNKPLQSPLLFKRMGNGGMQNRDFMLIHYTRDRAINTISF